MVIVQILQQGSTSHLARLRVVRFLSLGFAMVYEHESLSLRESRPLRAGEGQEK